MGDCWFSSLGTLFFRGVVFVVGEEGVVVGDEALGVVEVGEFEEGHAGAACDFGFFGVGELDEFGEGERGVVEAGGLEVEGGELFFEFEGVAGGFVVVEGGEGGVVGELDGGGEVFGELEGF